MQRWDAAAAADWAPQRPSPAQQPFQCRYCLRQFSLRHNLNRHIRGVHKLGETYRCQCGETFHWSTVYKAHRDKCQVLQKSVHNTINNLCPPAPYGAVLQNEARFSNGKNQSRTNSFAFESLASRNYTQHANTVELDSDHKPFKQTAGCFPSDTSATHGRVEGFPAPEVPPPALNRCFKCEDERDSPVG